jgi:hypothetical protein
MKALLRLYEGSMKALSVEVLWTLRAKHVRLSLAAIAVKALFRLY